MSRYHQSGDPYWMTARFPGKCAKTGEPFAKGARVFRYKSGECYAGAAAAAAAADFKSCADDEAFMNGGESYGGGEY